MVCVSVLYVQGMWNVCISCGHVMYIVFVCSVWYLCGIVCVFVACWYACCMWYVCTVAIFGSLNVCGIYV